MHDRFALKSGSPLNELAYLCFRPKTDVRNNPIQPLIVEERQRLLTLIHHSTVPTH